MNLIQFLLDRPWNEPQAPAAVFEAPGLVTNEECALLYFLAKDYYTGAGSIVDLGCYLGRSTNCFGLGLLENSKVERKTDRIFSYDKFCTLPAGAEGYLDEYIKRLNPSEAQKLMRPEGLWFRPIFAKTIEPFGDLVTVYEGDVPPLPYNGGPIEILFIDLAKTEVLNNAVIEAMFPRLIPGQSIIVHQDFHHIYSWQIHFCMDFFAEYFRIVIDSVRESCVFLSVKEIPESKIAEFTNVSLGSRYPLEEGLESLTRMQKRLLPPYRGFIELNKVRWKNHFGADADFTIEQLKNLPLKAANLDGAWELWVNAVGEEMKQQGGF